MNHDSDDCGTVLVPDLHGGFTATEGDGKPCVFDEADGVSIPDKFLARRCQGLLGSQVDTVSCCTGVFNLYYHQSQESELLREHGVYVKAADYVPGAITRYWSQALIERGKDGLQLKIEFCRRHHLEVFWSMRMNDQHDSAYPSWLSQWKIDNPSCLMGKRPTGEPTADGNPYPEALVSAESGYFPYCGASWTLLNYEHPTVRNKALAILTDVCSRYDIDGVELDFYRHPAYFRPQLLGQPVSAAHAELMTGLLREIRRMTEAQAARRGRPLLIAVRVPDSVGFAREIGLDFPQWLAEDLIDILIGGCYHHFEPWETMVAVAKRHDAPFYACLSNSRLDDPAFPGRNQDNAVWRGEAWRAWQAGVSGIHTFNLFDPHSPLFREMGDPATLAGRPRRYQHKPEACPGETDEYLKGGSRFIKPDPWVEKATQTPKGV